MPQQESETNDLPVVLLTEAAGYGCGAVVSYADMMGKYAGITRGFAACHCQVTLLAHCSAVPTADRLTELARRTWPVRWVRPSAVPTPEGDPRELSTRVDPGRLVLRPAPFGNGERYRPSGLSPAPRPWSQKRTATSLQL